MTPFKKIAEAPRDFIEWERLVMKKQKITVRDKVYLLLPEMHRVFFTGDVYVNDTYRVLYHDRDGIHPRLSINRLDGSPCNSWMDFQQIKNELVGPEGEAMQLYPAESRLLDTDNVYHLFIFHVKLGFNFGRAVWSNEK